MSDYRLLQGKSAIVTGSGRGIGRSIAKLFAEHGASVVINDIDADVAQATSSEINDAWRQSRGVCRKRHRSRVSSSPGQDMRRVVRRDRHHRQ